MGLLLLDKRFLNPLSKHLKCTLNMFGVFLLRNITRISLFYSGYHICKSKSNIESPKEEECTRLFPVRDQNKMHMETNKEGTIMRYENPYG